MVRRKRSTGNVEGEEEPYGYKDIAPGVDKEDIRPSAIQHTEEPAFTEAAALPQSGSLRFIRGSVHGPSGVPKTDSAEDDMGFNPTFAPKTSFSNL